LKTLEELGLYIIMLKNNFGLYGLLIIGVIHSWILTKLLFFPYPELFIYPYLTNQGLAPYKQIFDQHFPGLMFLPINLDNLGMTNEIVARWWLIGIVLATHLLIFLVVSKITSSYKKALLGNLLYLIWQPFLEGWTLWIDNFLPLFLLPAFYFTYLSISQKKSYRSLFLAGFFLSLGILFKQVIIPLAGIIFLLVIIYLRDKKSLVYFLSGILPIPLLATAYYLSIGVIKEMWFWTITFNLTTFASFGGKAPFFSGIVRVIGVYSPSLLTFLIPNKKLAMVLLVFLLGSFTGDIARFDMVHFQPSLPFIVIITVLVFSELWQRTNLRLLILGYLLMIGLWLPIFYKGHLSDKVFFFDKGTYAIADKIKEYSDPKEEIYLFGLVPHLYQMTETIPVGKIFVFQFPWFLMETEELFLEVLQEDKPKLIVADRTVVIEGWDIKDFAIKLDSYITQNYEVVDSIGTTEFMRLKDKDGK